MWVLAYRKRKSPATSQSGRGSYCKQVRGEPFRIKERALMQKSMSVYIRSNYSFSVFIPVLLEAAVLFFTNNSWLRSLTASLRLQLLLVYNSFQVLRTNLNQHF